MISEPHPRLPRPTSDAQHSNQCQDIHQQGKQLLMLVRVLRIRNEAPESRRKPQDHGAHKNKMSVLLYK